MFFDSIRGSKHLGKMLEPSLPSQGVKVGNKPGRFGSVQTGDHTEVIMKNNIDEEAAYNQTSRLEQTVVVLLPCLLLCW